MRAGVGGMILAKTEEEAIEVTQGRRDVGWFRLRGGKDVALMTMMLSRRFAQVDREEMNLIELMRKKGGGRR